MFSIQYREKLLLTIKIGRHFQVSLVLTLELGAIFQVNINVEEEI